MPVRYNFSIALIVFILDQVSKKAVLHSLQLGESIDIIPPILAFTHVHNTGGAFSILQGQIPLFLIIGIITILGLSYYIVKFGQQESRLANIGYALFLGGATGNLFDRFFLAYVVDFIDFKVWPVFNIADICLCLGAALLITQSFSTGNDHDVHA